MCLIGPSLLDLQITANTDTKSIAMVFVGRAIGGATGAVLFAMVLSRCHPWRIISVAYIAMATSLASLPWIGHVIGVAAMYGLGGMGYCIADAGELTSFHDYHHIEAAILQTTLNFVLIMVSLPSTIAAIFGLLTEFRERKHFNFKQNFIELFIFLRVQSTHNKLSLVLRQWLGVDQTASHYLIQWWPILLTYMAYMSANTANTIIPC